MTLAVNNAKNKRITVKNFAQIPEVLNIPNLIENQLNSFEWFKREGLKELLEDISPITDFIGDKYELKFVSHQFKDPKYTEDECRERDGTYSAPLYVDVQLLVKSTGEIKKQHLFMGDVPMMTDKGTFVINGAERVVVSQLVRSPGVYFTQEEEPSSGRGLGMAKLIPNRGAWLEFETNARDVVSVKVDRKRKIPISTFLRALGYGNNDELLDMFKDLDNNPEHRYIKTTIDKDPIDTSRLELKKGELESLWQYLYPNKPIDEDAARAVAAAMIEFYRRLRPGEPPNLGNSRQLIQGLFFQPRRYDLGRVGRYKINNRLHMLDTKNKFHLVKDEASQRILSRKDLISIVRNLIAINNGRDHLDDIDHLGNRRVRGVGELIQNQLRIGLLRMERVVRERMTLIDPETAVPSALINIRPIVAAVKEFFGGSQLSQFMDQTNPLAELTHKRRLSALGPGGLSRERAGFDVRDVHHSHYGRICPIETPEGPNIGLLGSLATYAKINPYGFIETPYRPVVRELPADSPDLIGKMVREDVVEGKDTKPLVRAGTVVTADVQKKLASLKKKLVKIKPYVTQDISYLSADTEDEYTIAQANSRLNHKGEFVDAKLEVRKGEQFLQELPANVDFMDVSPKQIVSVSTALIPFLEHDDANRALMGSNMQRQGVPLIRAEAPIVGTGMEGRVARDSGQVILSLTDGEVVHVGGTGKANQAEVVVRDPNGKDHSYKLMKFVRSNQGTCINQKIVVTKGDKVKKGQPLADSYSTSYGDLALGQNILCAFMSWEGYNFEDAIILSRRLVRDDKFTSIHIEKHEMEARDTKLGPEEITRDIPNVGEESLKDLDEEGIIHIGAEVGPGDILVGKITPKGETELTAEEKLLRAIFGEKAREVKDTSLRVPHGERGKIIDVRVFSQENHDDLPPGVNKLVRIWIAQTRKISEGDKMAGRHGNKGVVARIMPEEDMPFLPDGTPIDIVLNPIGVPSRMNLGQVLETHLGWAANALGFKAVTPVFDGARDYLIEDAIARAWLLQRSQTDETNLDEITAIAAHADEIDITGTKAWLKENGYDGEKIFSDSHAGEAKKACLKIWLKDQGEKNVSKLNEAQLIETAVRIQRERGIAAPITGKITLYDGRTGEKFDQPITIGYIYMMKLIHLVEDKIHARSTGPYSLITQQPLGGKAQFGGQRFGEMEVWALEAYSAAHNLQEMLTIKSDDVVGRVKTYESIVKGEDVAEPGLPESFNVLLKELQSLGLSIELLNEDDERVVVPEASQLEEPEIEKGLTIQETKDA
ncbi:MAG: DNA-directed RNA polymerase subunit beta [Dehalococcoidia bacterium]|nr:DNA-directed RNA polymerase subunit beta [Dehalococcoidia bacterium]